MQPNRIEVPFGANPAAEIDPGATPAGANKRLQGTGSGTTEAPAETAHTPPQKLYADTSMIFEKCRPGKLNSRRILRFHYDFLDPPDNALPSGARPASVPRKTQQSTAHSRPHFFQRRQQLMADAVPGKPRREIAFVLAPGQPALPRIRLQPSAWRKQERAYDAPPALRNPRETIDPGAAHHPEQHGLRLIVGVVSGCDMLCTDVIRCALQERVPCTARCRFTVEVRIRARRVNRNLPRRALLFYPARV